MRLAIAARVSCWGGFADSIALSAASSAVRCLSRSPTGCPFSTASLSRSTWAPSFLTSFSGQAPALAFRACLLRQRSNSCFCTSKSASTFRSSLSFSWSACRTKSSRRSAGTPRPFVQPSPRLCLLQ